MTILLANFWKISIIRGRVEGRGGDGEIITLQGMKKNLADEKKKVKEERKKREEKAQKSIERMSLNTIRVFVCVESLKISSEPNL